MNQEVYNLKNILENIKYLSNSDSLRITLHCQQEMAEENIKLNEVKEAIATGESLENYPDHQSGPCCLLNVTNKRGETAI